MGAARRARCDVLALSRLVAESRAQPTRRTLHSGPTSYFVFENYGAYARAMPRYGGHTVPVDAVRAQGVKMSFVKAHMHMEW